MPQSDCFVSVVAPLSNDAEIAEPFVAEVMKVLEENYTNFELVLVDDGSRDDTVARVTALLDRYKCIRLIRLSRSFGREIAMACGLDAVIGDCVVTMLPDSDPPQLIPEMVREVRKGKGVVFGVRSRQDDEIFPMRVFLGLFHWFNRHFLRLAIPRNASHFHALSRQAVNAINQIKEKYRYLHLLSIYVGFENKSFPYDPIRRHQKPHKKSFWDSVGLAIGVIVSNSKHPLRFVSWLGLCASVLNALYVCYIVLIYLFKKNVAEGWTTLSLQTAGMFFFVFLILTVLSEYIGRILDESKGRPLYYVLEERNSSVLIADRERRNVVTESEHLPTKE